MAWIRKQIRSHGVGMLALVIALGGTSYAAGLARNSVGTRHLKVGAVTSAKVKDLSLRAVDFDPSELPQGDQGEQGPEGPIGPPGVVGAVTVQRTDVALPDGLSAAAEVECPAGTRALGGGSSAAASTATDIHLTVSRPGTAGVVPDDGQGFSSWRVVYVNEAGGTAETTIRAFVICGAE